MYEEEVTNLLSEKAFEMLSTTSHQTNNNELNEGSSK
jgi:hypothetical protein